MYLDFMLLSKAVYLTNEKLSIKYKLFCLLYMQVN